jgi:hypothetical protein
VTNGEWRVTKLQSVIRHPSSVIRHPSSKKVFPSNTLGIDFMRCYILQGNCLFRDHSDGLRTFVQNGRSWLKSMCMLPCLLPTVLGRLMSR